MANVKVPELIAKLDKLNKQETQKLILKQAQALEEGVEKAKGQREADAAAMQKAGPFFNTEGGANDVVRMLENQTILIQTKLKHQYDGSIQLLTNTLRSLYKDPELK